MYNSIKTHIDKWANINLSLAERVSTVKMNILPRVNFMASMLPLPAPTGFWDKLQARVSKHIWKSQFPRIRMPILQHNKISGGLNVPDFKLYFYAFMLRPLKNWFNGNLSVSWVEIEEQIVSPFSLKDILFSGLSNQYCTEKFGPIISHAIQTWNSVEGLGDWGPPWHVDTPIFRNNKLLIGEKPLHFPQWQNAGIHTLPQIINNEGLKSFEDLKTEFNLPGSSFFFYLQLRLAMRTYGVPWNQPFKRHPMAEMLLLTPKGAGPVSYIYQKLQQRSQTYMGIVDVWNIDLKPYNVTINWQRVWKNIPDTSRNYTNQVLNYKMIHRFYLSPRKCCQLQITPTPHCLLCPQKVIGTYIHMYWECADVGLFWRLIAQTLSDIIGFTVPCLPNVMLLNDDSFLSTVVASKNPRRVFFLGLVAAKKMLVMRWKPPHTLSVRLWKRQFHNILVLEASIARMNNAQKNTFEALEGAAALL